MLRPRIGLVVLLAVGLSGMTPHALGQRPPRTGVKELNDDIAGTKGLYAVVEAIDAGGMTVVETLTDNKTVTHKLVPVDRLKGGKVLRGVMGMRRTCGPTCRRGTQCG
jgi:hypothetical protein